MLVSRQICITTLHAIAPATALSNTRKQCTPKKQIKGNLKSKESKRRTEHDVLGLSLERRRCASELRRRRRTHRSCTSGLNRRPECRWDGVRHACHRSRRSGRLRGRDARDEADGRGGRGAGGGDFGGEVDLGHGEGGGAVDDGCDGCVGCVGHVGHGGRGGRSGCAGRLSAACGGCGRCRGHVIEGVFGAVVDYAGVLGNVLGADADEILECGFGLFVGLTPCLDAVDDVLGELGVLAVAVSSRVVLAVFSADLQPGVHASWQNLSNLLGREA
jgi:hypothetical protein